MAINRRRAPSSATSSEKKLSGHRVEFEYAKLIGGETISGTKKGDVKDLNGNLHSVKSGKKWQVFLYRYARVSETKYLKILLPCLDAFPVDYGIYVTDREKVIGFKEKYLKENGRTEFTTLSNETLEKELNPNFYIRAKYNLRDLTGNICDALKNEQFRRKFLMEAIFNNEEVEFLTIMDSTYEIDSYFKVFPKDYVLSTLSRKLFPEVSKAGTAPDDFNVGGQKIIMRYETSEGKAKNIVEIEIRNDSSKHYREVRFNMYSRDVLYLLLENSNTIEKRFVRDRVLAFGAAINSIEH